MKSITALIVVLLFVSCAPRVQMTPEQQAYTEKAMAFPTEFTITADQKPGVWQRAQSFLSQYASMKIQVLNDMSIQTYNPHDIGQYGYTVNLVPTNQGYIVRVDCFPYRGNMFWNGDDEAEQNAHVLAYYMASGELDALVY